MQGHLRRHQTRFRRLEQRHGARRLPSGRGRARAQEKRERVAPVRPLAHDRARVPLRPVEEITALDGIPGLAGHREASPRPGIDAADEAHLDEPLERPGGRAQLLAHVFRGDGSLSRIKGDVRPRAPDPEAQVVEPVALSPSSQTGLQLPPCPLCVVCRQPGDVGTEAGAQERGPQPAPSALGFFEERAQP